MSTREHVRLLLHLSGDERLVACVGAALAHFAARAGLGENVRAPVVAALENLCCRTIPLLHGEEDMLDVAIEDFDDRIEIVVEHHGDALPSVGTEPFLAAGSRDSARQLAGAELMRTVDRVEHNTRNGSVRTLLVKYLKP